MKLNNTYYIFRHGEAVSNKKNVSSSWPEKFFNPLTFRGKQQIKRVIPRIKKLKIDLIFSSDILRTKQTAEIIAKVLKLRVKFDKKLREINTGIFNGGPLDKWYEFYRQNTEFFIKKPKNGGENYREVKERAKNFLKKIDKKYKNKKILIVGHGGVFENMQALIKNYTEKQQILYKKDLILKNGELRTLLRQGFGGQEL
jgi:broad specificity phosphatase PhoE